MSDACPCAPPSGWWIMTSAFGRQIRFPFAPDESRKAPIDAAMPMQNGGVNKLNVQYACLLATIAPLLFIYPFIQKYFEAGMQVGAVKG